MSRVVVIGGGIAGLTAAFSLSVSADVTVLEASGRVGGKVETEPFRDVDLDTGPDSFLARVPAVTELCQAVGLGDQLIAPATATAYLWSRNRLRRLPPGLVLGAPSDLMALARSRVLSPAGTVRAALDLVLPPRHSDASTDRSVVALTRARYGPEAHWRLVDPLLGGINAGRTEELSLAVTAPGLAAAAQSGHRSLSRALREIQWATPASTSPVFLTVRGGLRRLTSALVAAITANEGSEVRVGEGASALTRGPRGAWTITTSAGHTLAADAVVVAVPAPAAARLLGEIAPMSARALSRIAYSSVVLVTLAYRSEDIGQPLDGSGFLVPRIEGRLLTACSWVGAKWPHLAQPGQTLLRVSAGRARDGRALALADGALVDRLHDELGAALRVRRQPEEARVHRWVDAFPQFAPGHLERTAAVEGDLAVNAPGIAVAGAAYRGVGLTTCVVGAQAAAAKVRLHLARRPVADGAATPPPSKGAISR
jgi:oxygen-dependent protoporphyrinogen oxidase